VEQSRRFPRLRRPWLLALALALAIPAACTALMFLAPEDPAPYLATIEALPAPPAWQIVHTQALRDLMGSRADRYYLVDAEPDAIAPVVQDLLRSAGLEIYDRVADSDWCDSRPISASPAIICPRKEIATCQANGRGGPVSCTFFDVGVYDQRHRVEASNRALVVISADRVTARTFWSSPTPLASETPQ
jgi:hypothetical protein